MTNEDTIKRVAQGLAHTEYSLLLGAGASIGAVGGNKRALPTGIGLRDALVSDFQVPTDGEELSLSQIFAFLQQNTHQPVEQYLEDWFSNCEPSWQNLLAEFNWKRIWSLNIDDVLEQAYKKEGRPLEALTWNERFSERSPSKEQQLIHLHGIAGNLSTKEGSIRNRDLVFSLSDYVYAVTNARTWHKVFLDEFAGHPFIIIGAQLTEEIDLLEALQRGSAARSSTGFPSVLVVPTITSIRRSLLESSGFAIIESEGENFIRELLKHYRKIIAEIGNLYAPTTPGLRRFLQQFIDLRSFNPQDNTAGDFYSGYQPTWNTILSEDDAILEKTSEVANETIRLATEESIFQEIKFLTGNLGTGKSTALLRIGEGLKGAGMHPFFFRADEYMDVDSVIEWLKAVPRTVLLCDDFADFSSTIQQLCERCREEGVRLLLVCSDRASRRPLIVDRIDPLFLNSSKSIWYGKLSDHDIDFIISKLYSRGRLGKITRWNPDNQRRHFIQTANRSLFDAMADLEGGRGFRETVRNVYRGLPSNGLKDLYAAACLCYDQSIPLPTGIGANICGVTPKELVNLIEAQCSGILLLTRVGIRPPHRITANLVVNALPRSARATISLELAKLLAPHVDERAMRTGTREYRLARQLMNHTSVIRSFPQVSQEVEGRSWYESVREYYDWNGRYWDQRALFESRFGKHEAARSFAERSIQVHPHSFGYNTLGTVLLRMAIQEGSIEALYEGIKNLEESKHFRDWGDREHPYTAFFTSLIRYAQEWGIAEIPGEVRNDWTAWFREAQSSNLYAAPQRQQQLNEWQKTWLQLAVSPRAFS